MLLCRDDTGAFFMSQLLSGKQAWLICKIGVVN